MKKWLICLAALTAVLLSACGEQNTAVATEPAAEPQTQLHTVAPRREQPVIEWVSVDAQMTLEDSEMLYAKGGDFVCFALVVNDDGAEIRFKLDDVTAGMLRGQDPANKYYVTMNDKRLGDVVLNDDCSELTLVGDFSYTQLCTLANRIRGLE